MEAITKPQLLNERDVAQMTGLSVASLRRRRSLNQLPRYYKLGSSVKYKPSDVFAWIDAQPTGGVPQEAA
jgi:predicted DNA-binding transcriptional regulator AlpA